MSRIAILVAMGVALGGCVSGNYAKAVGDFSTTVQKSRAAFDDVNQQSMKLEDRRIYLRAIEEPGELKFGNHSCLRRSEGCTLLFKGRQVPSKDVVENVSELFADFSGYAKGLGDIANSTARADVDKAMSSIQTNLKQLATAAKMTGPTLNYVDPVIGLLGWVVGTYLDQVRYDAIKEAVTKADPIISQASEIFAQTSSVLLSDMRNALVKEVGERRREFREKKTRESYDALLDTTRTFDAVLKLDPEKQILKLGTAHSELKKAFDKGDFGSVIENLDAWQRELDQVGKIIGAFVSASKQK